MRSSSQKKHMIGRLAARHSNLQNQESSAASLEDCTFVPLGVISALAQTLDRYLDEASPWLALQGRSGDL